MWIKNYSKYGLPQLPHVVVKSSRPAELINYLCYLCFSFFSDCFFTWQNIDDLPHRMVWLEAPGVTGPTTLPLLCVRSRTSLVFRSQWDFGILLDLLRTVAWRTSSDAVRRNSSMAEFQCSRPWGTLLPRHYDLQQKTTGFFSDAKLPVLSLLNAHRDEMANSMLCLNTILKDRR